MMNHKTICAASSVSRSEALLRGGSLSCLGFSDSRHDCPGGLGGVANQKNYRGVLAAPMLASLNNTQLKKSDNQQQNKGTKMNKPKPQKHQTTPYKLTHLISVTSLLLFSIFTSSCSTTCHRREAALHVLEQQNTVLQVLKTERESGEVQTKTANDPALSKAEAHLREAMKSLTESNQALKAEF